MRPTIRFSAPTFSLLLSCAVAAPAYAQGCNTTGATVGPPSNPKTACVTPVQATTTQLYDPNGGYSSQDGRFYLTAQSDGNVVLHQYGPNGSDTILWASNTQNPYGYSGYFMSLNFQNDGNLVAYQDVQPGSTGTARWASGTSGNPGATLTVQNDGNVVIRKASGKVVWSTGTCCH